MSRTVSSTFISAANAQETDEVIICLLTVTHEEIPAPIYLSSDATERLSADPLIYGTTSRGNQHLYLPFEFTLPDDKSDSPPRVILTMDNTDRSLVELLRSISTPADVLVEIVLGSDLNHVELVMPSLQLSDVTIDEGSISATLVSDSLINEPYPAGLFTPGAFPGLF